MPTPSNPPAARAPKAKTAKQRAKAEANKAAYAARNAEIARRRETLAAITGVKSSIAAAEAALDRIEREQETENARKACDAEMANPVYGQRLSRFIGSRPGVDPCRLLIVIRNWKACDAEMANPVYGQRLSRFIGSRPGVDPCRLLIVIRNWKRVQGITVDHVRPTQG